MRSLGTWKKSVRTKVIDKLFVPRTADTLKELVDIQQEDGNLFLYGSQGVGKTTEACLQLLAIYREHWLKAESRTYAFTKVSDLYREITDCYDNSNNQSESKIIDKYRFVDYLVLDDIGINTPSENLYRLLYMIVDYRYDYKKPMIITSNLDIEELTGLFGGDKRITSRISRQCRIVKKLKFQTSC